MKQVGNNRVIDIHSHLLREGYYPRAFYACVAEEWAQKEPGRKPEMILPKLLAGYVDNDGKMFIENMDRAGVDIAFILGIDVGIFYSGQEPETPIEQQMEDASEFQKKYPDRLVAFGAIDPRRKNAVQLLEKAVKELGLIGVGEWQPEGYHLEDDLVQPPLKKCAELGVPVSIHTRSGHGADMYGNEFTLENPRHPEHIAWVLRKYPSLTVIIGHAGYPVWWEAATQVAKQSDRCYLDLSNWEPMLDDPSRLVPILAAMRDGAGVERLLFGSDQVSGVRFCFERSHLPKWVNFFKELPKTAEQYGYKFTEAECNMILGENAARLFNL